MSVHPRSRTCVRSFTVVVAACAAVLTFAPTPAGAAPAPPSTPGTEPVTAGDTIVGEVVRAVAEQHDPATDGAHPDNDAGADGTDGLLTWVQPQSGDPVRVPTDALDEVPLGATVEVTVGGEVRDAAAVEHGLDPAHAVLDSTVVAAAETPPTAPAALVTNAVTVAMVRPAGFAQDATTLANVVGLVDGPVAQFWSAQTAGAKKIGVVAQHDWLSTTASCSDPFALWNEAASRVGFVSGPGKHLILHVPQGAPGCAAGLGTVGSGPGTGGYIYSRYAVASVLAHEFGHNFGLWHSARMQCEGAQESGTCSTDDYGDYYDVMGASWDQFGTLNPAQAARIGLLPAGQVQTVNATGGAATVTLSPISGSAGVRAIRLVDASTGVTDAGGTFYPTTYYLEYRPAAGRDAYLGNTALNWFDLQPGVLLRREVRGTAGYSSVLIDATPTTGAMLPNDNQSAVTAGVPVSIVGGTFTIQVSNATTASATVSVYTHSDSPPAPPTPIAAKYAEFGGATGALGAATGAEVCGLTSNGCRQNFVNGSIFWSATTGARVVSGAIATRFIQLGGAGSLLGYPTMDTACTLRGGGCGQHFEKGSMYWAAATGARVVTGAVRTRYAALKAQNSGLGYPTTDTVCGLRGSGCAQHYQGGSIYYSPRTGARVVAGAIRARYLAVGAHNSRWGYPTSDQYGIRGGVAQKFQGAVVTYVGGRVRP